MLHYILDHKLGSATITSTTFEFLIPNCTIDLDIEVRAVSRCDSTGNSTTETVPPLSADNSAIAPEQAMNQGILQQDSALIKISFNISVLLLWSA